MEPKITAKSEISSHIYSVKANILCREAAAAKAAEAARKKAEKAALEGRVNLQLVSITTDNISRRSCFAEDYKDWKCKERTEKDCRSSKKAGSITTR